MRDSTADFLIPVRDVAKRLGISTSTVWLLVSKGHLPEPVRIGSGNTRWRSSDIDRVIKGDKND